MEAQKRRVRITSDDLDRAEVRAEDLRMKVETVEAELEEARRWGDLGWEH